MTHSHVAKLTQLFPGVVRNIPVQFESTSKAPAEKLRLNTEKERHLFEPEPPRPVFSVCSVSLWCNSAY